MVPHQLLLILAAVVPCRREPHHIPAALACTHRQEPPCPEPPCLEPPCPEPPCLEPPCREPPCLAAVEGSHRQELHILAAVAVMQHQEVMQQVDMLQQAMEEAPHQAVVPPMLQVAADLVGIK